MYDCACAAGVATSRRRTSGRMDLFMANLLAAFRESAASGMMGRFEGASCSRQYSPFARTFDEFAPRTFKQTASKMFPQRLMATTMLHVATAKSGQRVRVPEHHAHRGDRPNHSRDDHLPSSESRR